jgi:hypothetical protein
MATILVVAAVAATSHAGWKTEVSVFINEAGGYFYGQVGSARNSADNLQYISCSVQAGTSGAPLVSCYAQSTAGGANGSAMCTASSQTLADIAKAITSYSFIYVNFDPSTGVCTLLEVDNYSPYRPMTP